MARKRRKDERLESYHVDNDEEGSRIRKIKQYEYADLESAKLAAEELRSDAWGVEYLNKRITKVEIFRQPVGTKVKYYNRRTRSYKYHILDKERFLVKVSGYSQFGGADANTP